MKTISDGPKISQYQLKYIQIDAAFLHIFDEHTKYYKSGLISFYEFGVYRGSSLLKTVNYINNNLNLFNNKPPHIFGFDSFEGLPPEKEGLELFAKFKKGSYKLDEKDPLTYIQNLVCYDNLHLINKPFEDLSKNDVVPEMGKAIVVHIDCDLYVSTKQALKFLLENDLIGISTLLCFDEFCSTSNYKSGGESKAFFEMCDRYKLNCEEIFHYTYLDKDTKQPIRQNIMKVIK